MTNVISHKFWIRGIEVTQIQIFWTDGISLHEKMGNKPAQSKVNYDLESPEIRNLGSPPLRFSIRKSYFCLNINFLTLRAETFAEQFFAVNCSETCKFWGINFRGWLQSFTKYLRETLVFKWNSALMKKLIYVFLEIFAGADKVFILGKTKQVLRFCWYFLSNPWSNSYIAWAGLSWF